MLDDDVVGRPFEVVVRAEPEVVVGLLTRCVDPPPLVPTEGPLLVIVRDDVLPQLGADRFQDISEVANDGKTSKNGVSLLENVVEHDYHHRESYNPEPHGLIPVVVSEINTYFILPQKNTYKVSLD